MSKEVLVVAWCDGDHEPQERATVERTVAVDGGRPILLDLCEPCDKVFADLAELMERGVFVDTKRRPPTKKPAVVTEEPRPSQRANTPPPEERVARTDLPPDQRVDCLEPGCLDPRTSKQYIAPTRSALGQHVKQKHGKLLSDYDWTA